MKFRYFLASFLSVFFILSHSSFAGAKSIPRLEQDTKQLVTKFEKVNSWKSSNTGAVVWGIVAGIFTGGHEGAMRAGVEHEYNEGAEDDKKQLQSLYDDIRGNLAQWKDSIQKLRQDSSSSLSGADKEEQARRYEKFLLSIRNIANTQSVAGDCEFSHLFKDDRDFDSFHLNQL